MTNFEWIMVTTQQQIEVIELNRPERLNAMNRKMVREIVEAMQAADAKEDVRVIVLVGKGHSFSAGADIEEMAAVTPIQLELYNQFADWDQLASIKKPIIGAVHGYVFGGGFELALCCDVLFAAKGTSFSFPEVSLGIMPGAGGTQRLTKLVGRTKAIEWLWTGDRIDAEVLWENGVVNQIVAPELVREETLRFATRLSNLPPLSLRLVKDAVNKAVDYSLYEGMQYERKNFYLLFSSEDQKEGMQAFVEKREPNFKGR